MSNKGSFFRDHLCLLATFYVPKDKGVYRKHSCLCVRLSVQMCVQPVPSWQCVAYDLFLPQGKIWPSTRIRLITVLVGWWVEYQEKNLSLIRRLCSKVKVSLQQTNRVIYSTIFSTRCRFFVIYTIINVLIKTIDKRNER